MILLLFGLAGGGANALAATANSPTADNAARLPTVPTAQPGVTHTTQAIPAALRPALYRALAKDTGAAYDIKSNGCAELPQQALTACFDAEGARFSGADSPLALHLVAFGRNGELASIPQVRPEIAGNEASYVHGNLTEWWRVLPVGFEQGFTIVKRPSGHGELTLALAASQPDAGPATIRHSRESRYPVGKGVPTAGRDTNSDWIPASAGMTKKEHGNTLAWGKLRYGELVVTDAHGKTVPATLTTKGKRILIAVNDTNAVYPLTVDPLVWLEQKVTASDGAALDEFGYSVALDGSTALVGARYATVSGNTYQGAAYVFRETNGAWTQTAKLTASDGAAYDGFGGAVDVSGTTALVGAGDAHSAGGAAYVFTESGGIWSQTQELTPSAGGGNFGWSVALDGSTALIGAPSTDPAVYVFTESGGIWSQTQELTASDGSQGGEFGASIALDGSTALVGALNATVNGNPDQGAAYVFIYSGGNWSETQKLAASDGTEGEAFGTSVTLDGATALVGAPADSAFGYSQGAAYMFTYSGGSWSETQKLAASDGTEGDGFGTTVALDGATALVGAPSATVNGNNFQGAAYVFTDSGGSWVQTQKFTASDGAAYDLFGSVALDGSTAVVGAYQAGGSARGAAYFYGASDLGLAVSAPETVALGENYLSQTIATNNASAASPAVTATIAVPAAASFISATATQGACSEAAGVVTCAFGAIPGNAGTATANVTLKAAKNNLGTTLANTASMVHATPALTAGAATAIGCPAGYTEYDGALAPGELWKSPRYRARAGIQNGILISGDGIKLFAAYWHHDTHQWQVYGSSRANTIHHWGPNGQYHWLANARALGPGGAYALCVLHP